MQVFVSTLRRRGFASGAGGSPTWIGKEAARGRLLSKEVGSVAEGVGSVAEGVGSVAEGAVESVVGNITGTGLTGLTSLTGLWDGAWGCNVSTSNGVVGNGISCWSPISCLSPIS